MAANLFAAAVAIVVVAASMRAPGGRGPRSNQEVGDARRGAALFAESCASCHGVDARGLNGPNLTPLFSAASAAGDERVFQTIRRGVAGSMPASTASDEDVRAIVAHLKRLAAASAGARAASERTQVTTIVTRDGGQFRGEKKNEDAFSIQLDVDGRLVGFLKSAPAAPAPAPAPIAYLDLLDGFKDPTRWLSFHGDYTGQRHSPLTAITRENVGRLAAEWTFQTGTVTRGRGFEATPLAYDGVLYVTGSNDLAWALDARTGRPFWSYRRELPNDLTYGAQAPVNRGFAMLGDRLFMTTLDAHLVALDRRSGKIVWDVVVADYKAGYAATLAPLVVRGTGASGEDNGKVIVGISGGEYPTRGFLDAYDPATGGRLWRFYTVPAPGEPGSETWPDLPETLARGGGATWMTGTYDPDLDLLYWGTGNPNPDYYGESRKGDNLFTNSLVAIDARTGTPRWHYQFTPHDTHDWDSNQIPVLADLTIGGAARKVVMLANRNGFFYVLDRRDGTLILAKPFTDTTWAREIGGDGRPIVLNDGTKDCVPDMWGGTNFNPPSFDATLRLFFVNARETCAVFVPQKPTGARESPLRQNFGGTVRIDREKQYGALRAIDPVSGERKWEFRYPSPTMAGVLSTASGLVFAGDNEGNLGAFDARTGASLWRYATGTPIWGAAPMTFMLDNRQHVVIASGTTLVSFAVPPESNR
ncbi:MAG TPA: PQQ-dependent dehydrogenase, methanol/ethanol family [Vicinamibacterales bacterium]